MHSFIRGAPFGIFLLMVVLPLAMAGVAAYSAWHSRRRAALIRRTQTSRISTAADGYWHFEGTVEAVDGLLVTAPLSHAPCCWYDATVEQWLRLSVSGRHGWATVRSMTSSAPFLLRDASGVCVVRPFGADVTPTDRSQWTGASLEPEVRNPPRFGPLEAVHGLVQGTGGAGTTYRYSEARIYAGDPLVVLGAYTSWRFTGEFDDGADDAHIEDLAVPEDAADATAVDPALGSHPWQTADDERFDALTTRAELITKAEIQKGGGKPLILATTPQALHVAPTEPGGRAAALVALVPLALATWVVWARFGG